MLEWKHIKIELKDLKLLENNPRLIKENKFENLKQSIDDLGVFRPLVIDYDGKTILAGNQRYRALLEKYPLNYKADCMTPNRKLNAAEKEKIIIMDNVHYGEWDFDILANEFNVEDLLDLGFNINDFPKPDLPNDFEEGEEGESSKDKTKCPNCGFEL